MSSSDDNDKTQIKPLRQGTPDKTEIQFNRQSSRSATSEIDNPLQVEKEEHRRKLAQKKAKELEKRLALIAAKKAKLAKKSQEQKKSLSEEDFGTNLYPAVSSLEDSSLTLKTHDRFDDDQTRVQSRKVPESSSNSDQTRFRPKTNLDNQNADATQFQPKKDVDATEISSKTIFKPFQKRSNTGEHAKLDKTLINENVEELNKNILSDGDEVLKNRFILEKVLGAGGMGVVYRARDKLKEEAQDRDPHVAIKVLSNEFKSHPEAFIALQRESRRTQRIAHPNIVNVHDFDRDGDTVFMTMEYLEGKPLDKLISQYKSTGLPEEDVWKVLEGISAALIYAHDQKIIHSDFKPGNIFVTTDGTAKVFDFGIARAVAKAEQYEDSEEDKTVFDAGNLGALTPAYASYEMLEGKTPDVRDDIYALGCIAYEMFTGEHPFNRVHANEAYRQKLKPKRIPGLSKRQWRVIEKSIAFEREDRIATVEEFWFELTKKNSSRRFFAFAALIVMGLSSTIAYQVFLQQPEQTISEDAVRSEIEREFLIDQNKQEIVELLQIKAFTGSWESRIYTAVQTLRELLGDEDPWLKEQELLIYQSYIEMITQWLQEEQFDEAKSIHVNAYRYTNDKTELDALLENINATEVAYMKRQEDERLQKQQAQEKKQKEQKRIAEAKRIRQEFDVALATVNKQLTCRSTMNIRDIDIAVSKLRNLDKPRYNKVEEEIVTKLSACIVKIGQSFPERGEESKKRALRIFPESQIIANISIEPKDPCDTSLAGLGARGERAICRDPLKSEGDYFGKGPSLVVIPGKGSVKPFAIGKYELTFEDLNRFCSNSNTCDEFNTGDEKLPATDINVKLVFKYAAWLSKMSKRKYRLPTKAEWTYAARANSSKLDSNRNCQLNSRGIQKGGVLLKATTGRENAWGLVNHVGNARELVLDGGAYAALGGSYTTAMERCVVTNVESHTGRPDELTGFRLLREIESK